MECRECKKTIKPKKGSLGASYAIDKDGQAICYDCCAVIDRKMMIADGRSKGLPLYYSRDKHQVSNWPGTLVFKCMGKSLSPHNWGLTRTDFWFYGPDNHLWHGFHVGHNNGIAHCRRTKRTKKAIYEKRH